MKNNIKKLIITVLVGVCAVMAFTGCGKGTSENNEKKVVKIGITTPDDIIWDAVKKKAAEDNIEVETVNFSNVNINQVLADGDIDLNAFQHYAYFEKNIKDLGLNLVSIGDTYILRLDVYSKKYKSLDELPNGAKIAVPNDPVNIGRSLKVFEEAGLIKLKEGSKDSPETADIESNPKNIELVEIEHSQIARSLDDVDAGIIFVKDAVDAGLDPSKDPIYINDIDFKNPELKQYINLLQQEKKIRIMKLIIK